MLFFHKSYSKIILYFFQIWNKVAQMRGKNVLTKKLRFLNKSACIDTYERVIWSVVWDLDVKNKIILIIIWDLDKIMSSNRGVRPDSIENEDESYSSSE
jgi:hypothetical protein